MKAIVDDIMQSRCLPKQSCLTYVHYTRFGRMKENIFGVLPLLKSLYENREKGKELGISHLDSEVLHGIRGSFVFLLIGGAGFYINNATKLTAFHATSVHRIG